MAVRNILRHSVENITVFCFCSTDAAKERVTTLLKKEKYPIVIIMPYDKHHAPDYPLVKCCASIYTTLDIVSRVMAGSAV